MDKRLQAIVGATVAVGVELEPIRDSVVILGDERIAAIGTPAETEAPPGAEVVEATGLTLLPGFIDAHVHIGFFEPSEVLARGVTTCRDLGWPPEEIFGMARASLETDFDGPTIVAAGPILTAPGGYPTRAAWAPPGTGREVAGPSDAKNVVEELVRLGAAVVKIALNPPVGPTFELETLRAIVDSAHENGLKVTGHVHDLAELTKALDAGVDELAHMLLADEVIPDDTIEKMVAAPMTVVPTLSIFAGPGRPIGVSNLRTFLEAGGDVVYGTDLGNEGPGPGIDPLEISAMADAGMSSRDIITAATVRAARHLGFADRGSIAVGKRADLVLVEGDPLHDPSDLTKVHAVWRAGRTRAS